jgi:hypothetical protein
MTDIKVEEASDTQEEQDPLLISSPEIDSEYEVSHIFACLSVSVSVSLPACQFHWMDFEDFFSLEACIILYIACVVTDPFGLICFNILWYGT